MRKMRLQDYEIVAIQEGYQHFFSKIAQGIFLFGSRVNLQKKGGDIDLYVMCHNASAEDVLKAEMKFRSYVLEKIGDQKLDIVIDLGRIDLPIYSVARTEGVKIA